jgi:hypothetical protein
MSEKSPLLRSDSLCGRETANHVCICENTPRSLPIVLRAAVSQSRDKEVQ